MSERYADLLAEWKKADEAARTAEKALAERYDHYVEGKGPEPTESEREEVHLLRHRANARLQDALHYIGFTAASRRDEPPKD
jgi:hypothetical protein